MTSIKTNEQHPSNKRNKTGKKLNRRIVLLQQFQAEVIQLNSAHMLVRGTAVKAQGAKHNVYHAHWDEYRASTIIQLAVQMHLNRLDYVNYQAARVIKSLARMYLFCSDYVDYRGAARIQVIARMHLFRSDYVEYWAATMIQSIAKMYIFRMDYVSYLVATTIQSVARMYFSCLDYIHCYQAPPVIQKVQPAVHYYTIQNAHCPIPYHNGPLASTARYDCLLDVILPQGAIYIVLSTPDNESKLLLHQNGEFICNIIFNMARLHYLIPYIDCTPPKTVVVFSTV